MKNALNYYYDVVPNEIRQNKNEYYFDYQGDSYLVQECIFEQKELEEIYKLIDYCSRYNVYFHQIILNKGKQFTTNINGKQYILLKKSNTSDKKIVFADLLPFSNMYINNFDLLKKNNWRALWIDRIDYVEYQMNELKNKYKLLSVTSDYFIGMAETAIQLIHDQEQANTVIAHRKIGMSTRVSELYNPLNLIIDTKVRDAAEYFKNEVFKQKDVFENILKYLHNNNLTLEEVKLFFIRMLYVTPYFNIYDKIMRKESEEEILNKFINNINFYEKTIRRLYNYLYNRNVLPEIEWLKK